MGSKSAVPVSQPAQQRKGTGTLRMHALTGIVVAVKPKTGKIKVHAHIDGVRAPMERDYALQDATAIFKVKEKDFVRATLLTDNANVWLLDEVTFVTKGSPSDRV